MTDISPPMSVFPLDVLRDCMDHLPLKDILTCQQVNTALDDLIRHSSVLRLRRHLGENGIQPSGKSQDHQTELHRLQEIESRLSNVTFGRSFPHTETYQVSATNTPDMHLIAVADSDVFLPVAQEGEPGIIVGIAKYSLSDCKKAPEILEFGRVVRHFQVEPAEGVLLIIFLDEGFVPGKTVYKHSAHLLCKDTMKPLTEAITGLTFSSVEAHQAMPNCQLRGEFLVVTCLPVENTPDASYTVKLIHWKSRKLLLNHKVKGAKHVVARLLSSTALVILEVYETSAQLSLFAYHSNPNEIEEEPLAFPVAWYALPALPSGFTYITAHFDCSPVSLSERRKDRGTNHLLEDGAGIYTITLEMQSWVPSETDVEGDYPADDWHVSWDFMTAVGLIDGFHRAAKKALEGLNRGGTIAISDFDSWASRSLSWLPKHTFPPSRNSICGYRLAMTEDSQNDGSDGTDGKMNHGKCVSIYDFTPAHVKGASMTAYGGTSNGEDSATVDVSHSWAMASQDSMDETAIKSVIKRSAPSVAPRALSDALARYGTDTPYLVSTRSVRLPGPDLQSVVHLTHDYLLFAQVRGFSED